MIWRSSEGWAGPCPMRGRRPDLAGLVAILLVSAALPPSAIAKNPDDDVAWPCPDYFPCLRTIATPSPRVVDFSPDESRVAVGNANGALLIYDARNGELVRNASIFAPGAGVR